VRRLPLLALVALLAACGGSKHASGTTTRTQAPPPGDVLYQGKTWSVTLSGTTARAYHLVGEHWIADRSGDPKIDILGPKPGQTVAATPQVAFQVTGKTDLVDTALWVDGVEILGKGGGLTPKRGTVYGAPASPLKPGAHIAIAYGRDAKHGHAVAWAFRT
jgi:hypothetical protein